MMMMMMKLLLGTLVKCSLTIPSVSVTGCPDGQYRRGADCVPCGHCFSGTCTDYNGYCVFYVTQGKSCNPGYQDLRCDKSKPVLLLLASSPPSPTSSPLPPPPSSASPSSLLDFPSVTAWFRDLITFTHFVMIWNALSLLYLDITLVYDGVTCLAGFYFFYLFIYRISLFFVSIIQPYSAFWLQSFSGLLCGFSL